MPRPTAVIDTYHLVYCSSFLRASPQLPTRLVVVGGWCAVCGTHYPLSVPTQVSICAVQDVAAFTLSMDKAGDAHPISEPTTLNHASVPEPASTPIRPPTSPPTLPTHYPSYPFTRSLAHPPSKASTPYHSISHAHPFKPKAHGHSTPLPAPSLVSRLGCNRRQLVGGVIVFATSFPIGAVAAYLSFSEGEGGTLMLLLRCIVAGDFPPPH